MPSSSGFLTRLTARPDRDRGELWLGYLATLALVVTVTVALMVSGLPGQVSGGVRTAICTITGETGCGQKTTPLAAGSPATATESPATSTAGPGATGGQHTGGDDGNCWT